MEQSPEHGASQGPFEEDGSSDLFPAVRLYEFRKGIVEWVTDRVRGNNGFTTEDCFKPCHPNPQKVKKNYYFEVREKLLFLCFPKNYYYMFLGVPKNYYFSLRKNYYLMFSRAPMKCDFSCFSAILQNQDMLGFCRAMVTRTS